MMLKFEFRPYIDGIFFYIKIHGFSLYRDETTGVSIFVRIPHCLMYYCIPAYSTVSFIEQGLACNSVE